MTFRHWLKGHEQDNTPIGNLARDVAQDRDIPRLKVRASWYRYLIAQHACDAALSTFERAWKAYERGER